jgi:pimeloyl-ACP methyl ester carboxylesterase
MTRRSARGVPVDRVERGFAWRERGEGPAVLFLHGLGLTRTGWEPQLRSLADHRRCVAWDMPGYGDSRPLDELTFESLADSVVRCLDLIGENRADLVGHSFGGMQAIHTAIHHPDRVRRLVLASTSPAFGLDGTDAATWREARLARIDAGESPADIASDVLSAVSSELDTATLEELAASFARIPADGFREACQLLPCHDVRARLGEIGAATLVVVGADDVETPVTYAEALAAAIPDGRLAVLDGVGHLAAAEAPARFNELVRAFLDERESRP